FHPGGAMLDERLTLAAALYPTCELGADIGTDHGYLPCHLLEAGVCRRMILADVSQKALRRAEAEVARRGLQARAALVCADGLDALTERCGCVSIMGMGGETLAGILLRGQERLQGATLVLSAHTELPLVRRAIVSLGYHMTRETLCRSGGRFYLFWRAEPGPAPMTEEEIRHGSLLYQENTPLLREYLAWRRDVAQAKLAGLRVAAAPDAQAIALAEQDVDFYQRKLEA
ncbi:MAG: class I SAM-dependent methyltransferase, partial [Aristaeellaceae bacterium]